MVPKTRPGGGTFNPIDPWPKTQTGLLRNQMAVPQMPAHGAQGQGRGNGGEETFRLRGKSGGDGQQRHKHRALLPWASSPALRIGRLVPRYWCLLCAQPLPRWTPRCLMGTLRTREAALCPGDTASRPLRGRPVAHCTAPGPSPSSMTPLPSSASGSQRGRRARCCLTKDLSRNPPRVLGLF